MAIVIKSLEAIAKQLEKQDYIFKDLHLDIAPSETFELASGSTVASNDLKASYDLSAIKNSLRNLFNTKPGQRFLFPEFGLDIYQYLFEAVSDRIAERIGNSIVSGVKRYEPRVAVKQCIITPDPDNNQYLIELILDVPIFQTNFSLNMSLDTKNETFIFFESTRNT